MNGYDFQRGSFESGGIKQNDSAMIQGENITAYMSYYETKHITNATNRRKHRRQKTMWQTNSYLYNGSDK